MINKKLKVGNVPNLRFPEFTEVWSRERIGSILTIGSGKDYKHLLKGTIPVFGTGGFMTSVNEYLYDGESVCIGRKGTINKPFYVDGKFWTVDTLFFTHSFQKVLPKFVYYVFEQINWLQYNEASGVPSLSKSTIEQIEINISCIAEQKKIAAFLSLLDSRINTQNKIIKELNVLKNIVAKKIFSQDFRFKDKRGRNFTEWNEMRLRDILDYEQPTNYLVSSTEYDNSFQTPVVTAGKTFILGYTDENFGVFEKDKLPVIIFDDFTTSTQFLDFQFKAKSSAMKILKARIGNNIKFIYEAMKMINYEIGGHGRHWISIFSNLEVLIPTQEEQTKIADFLSAIDSKIDIETQLLKKLGEQKKFLLQQLFV